MNNNLLKEISELRCDNNIIDDKIDGILMDVKNVFELIKLNNNNSEIQKELELYYTEYEIYFNPKLTQTGYYNITHLNGVNIITKTRYDYTKGVEYLYYNFI